MHDCVLTLTVEEEKDYLDVQEDEKQDLKEIWFFVKERRSFEKEERNLKEGYDLEKGCYLVEKKVDVEKQEDELVEGDLKEEEE